MSRKNELDVEVDRRDEDPLVYRGRNAMEDPKPEQQITEIRQGIEQTRAKMTETIDELQDRLSPSHLKDQVKEQIIEQFEQAKQSVRAATIGKVEDMVEHVKDTMYDTRRSILDTISANPIPSALVGIGLAWLWSNRSGASGSASPRYGDRYRSARGYDELPGRYPVGGVSRIGEQQSSGEMWDRTTSATRDLVSKAGGAVSGAASQVQETAVNLAGKAKETVSGMVDQAHETAGYLAGQAQHQARRVEESFHVAMRESPLALGAVALALGTAVGLAVPQTRKENEWMGGARDKLVDQAQSMAHDTMEQVQQVAQKVTNDSANRP